MKHLILLALVLVGCDNEPTDPRTADILAKHMRVDPPGCDPAPAPIIIVPAPPGCERTPERKPIDTAPTKERGK